MARTSIILGTALLLNSPSLAAEVAEALTVGGTIASAVQCQSLSSGDGDDDCRGAIPFQPEISYHPDETNELYVKFGSASHNALNAKAPFALAPWAADLENDVRDVNGHDRDHLLAAWYRHTVELPDRGAFSATAGIIDATDYLDDNAYSNDEYTQFMNSALVNGPNVFLPSYDAGAAVEWSGPRGSVRGVYMDVGESDDGNEYAFYGAQLTYHVDRSFGSGDYRLFAWSTNDRFADPTGVSPENRAGVGFSFDQQTGGAVGVFGRFCVQDDDAAVQYEHLYSGGVDLRGSSWGRDDDNIGIGYAYLGGGNRDLSKSRSAEVYYRFAVNRSLALTGDLQYMVDDVRGSGEDTEGYILGLRVALGF